MESTNIQEPFLVDGAVKFSKVEHHFHDDTLEQKLEAELAKEEDEFDEAAVGTFCNRIFWGILNFFNVLKMITMIGIILYLWVWTSDNRIVDMDVLEQLCKHSILNITFHENRLFGKVDDATAKENLNEIKRQQIKESDSTVFHNFATGAIGYMPDLKWKPDCKPQSYVLDKPDPNGLANPCLVRDSDIWGAFTKQCIAEAGDKTFLLIIIFTISWSNWHLDLEEVAEVDIEPKEEKKEDGNEDNKNEDDKDIDAFKTPAEAETNSAINEGGDSEDEELAKLIVKKEYPKTRKNVHIHPLRIYISATIGTVLANVMSISFQRNIYANETRLIVSILIVVFLLFYMYNICRSHLEWETEVEEIDAKHTENIYKMKKHDIIERFQEGEMDKKLRKTDQLRKSIRYGMYDLNKDILLNEGEEGQSDHELDEVETEKVEVMKHKEEVNVMAKGLWIKASHEALEIAEQRDQQEQEDNDKVEKEQEDDELVPDFVQSMFKELDEAEVGEKGSHISEAKRKLFKFLVDFRTEIIFLIFITSQEIQDTSYQTQIIMRTEYSSFANQMGCVFSHIVINFAAITVAYLYTGLCMTSKDSNVFGIATFYFITGYEFLFHILRWGAAYLDLLHYKGQHLN